MSKFTLKTKDGETINIVSANCINTAIEKFAIIKKLSKSCLLSIFIVETNKR